VGPSIVSANKAGCILNPVVNISGSTIISVGSAIAIIFLAKASRLAPLSSQKRAVCMIVNLSEDTDNDLCCIKDKTKSHAIKINLLAFSSFYIVEKLKTE
jgi:hypothetical protein